MPAAEPSTADPSRTRCSTCGTWKLATNEFFNIKHGKCPKTCRICTERKAKQRKKTTEDSTTGRSYPIDDGDVDEDSSDLCRVTLEEFLAIIAMDESARSFSALVDTQSRDLKGRPLADAIAKEVLHCVGYRFL
jgi:hypothetical protein